MKVLVTGAAGSIGSVLGNKLREMGHYVYGVDYNQHDFLPMYNDEYDKRIESFISIDEDVLKKYEIDTVFHLAADIVNVKDSLTDPVLTFDANTNDTIQFIDECRLAGIKRFVFASSAAVYGNNNNQKAPCYETMCYGPIDPYGASKLAVELWLQTYYKCFGFSYIALRLFNVYGPNIKKGVIYQMTQKGFKIHGDGTQVRDFIHIDDVVDAFIKAGIEKRDVVEVINVGRGQGIAIKDLAKMFNVKFRRYDTETKTGIPFSIASPALAEQLLGFKAKISLEVGLKSVLVS